MPWPWQAAIKGFFGSASISRPLTVIFVTSVSSCSGERAVRVAVRAVARGCERTALQSNVFLELGLEEPHRGERRDRGSVGERADRLPRRHALRQRLERRDVVREALTALDAAEDLRQPLRAFAALAALTAALVVVEARDHSH